MRELELKSVVDDLRLRRLRVEQAGGSLVFAGVMEDRHYTHEAEPESRGDVVRVRAYQGSGSAWTELTWKGLAHLEHGYKAREELTTRVEDGATLRELLGRMGFTERQRITREIAWYGLGGATLRFERFPRMDILVEVEGTPETIEDAIRCTGIPRSHFTSERLTDFVRRFESRTGEQARLAGIDQPSDLRGVRTARER